MNGNIGFDGTLTGNIATGGSGTTDYNDLNNKPSINGVSLYGNKTSEDLHLFTGDYDNLSSRPSINNVVLTGNKTAADLNLFDGNYDNLTNKPTLFSGDYEDLTNKPTLFSGDYDDLTNKPTLFDGDYDSLSNRPEINGVTLTGDQTADDLGLFDGDYDNLYNKPTLFSGDYNDLTNKPTLFSGDYNDLTNKPTLFDGNYMSLTNRPYINGVALENNRTTSDLLISYNDLLDRPTIPAIEFNPADPATDEVETIDLDGTIYEVKDADARAEISLLEDDIAPEYDSTATYSEGDYCMYAGTIYKANTDISTPEDFDSDHWDATSAGGELSEIKSSLSELIIIEKTASGTIVTFDDGSDLPMPYLMVLIEPLQSGSGDPSPINIRPISGWSDVNVTVADDVDNPTVENVYTINLGSTYYGGMLDVISGVLTVDRVMLNNWSHYVFGIFNEGSNAIEIATNVAPPKKIGVSNIISDKFKIISGWSDVAEFGVRGRAAYGEIIFKLPKTVAPTASAGRQWLIDNNVQAVYELDTPLTIQLTPTQVNSLLGINYIYADSGNLELKYFVNKSLVYSIYDMVNMLINN